MSDLNTHCLMPDYHGLKAGQGWFGLCGYITNEEETM